jgi:hypothetical protein
MLRINEVDSLFLTHWKSSAPNFNKERKMTTYEPYMVLEIAGHQYTLTGEMINNDLVVSYHKPFNQAIKLGTIDEMIGQVDDVLKLGGNLKKTWNDAEGAVRNIPLLGEVVNAIATAPIRITDIGIHTGTKEYSFGFALDFTGKDISVAEIKLQAFGFVVKTTKPS